MNPFRLFVVLLLTYSLAFAQFSPGLNNVQLQGATNRVIGGATMIIAGTLNGAGVFDVSGGTLTLATNQVPWVAVNKTGALLSDLGGVLTGAAGGTGVANTGKTITLGGNLTTSGAFATTFTMTAATGVTFPTTGTLATLAGAESLTNKKLGSLTTNGVVQTSGGDGTLSIATVTVPLGGTGDTTLTNHGVLLGAGTAAVTATAAGTSGAPFLSGGASADGAYGALNLAGGGSIVTGTLAVGNGGTGLATITANSIMVGNGTSAVSLLAPGTSGNVVTSNGTAWTSAATITGPGSSVDNDIVTWNSTTGKVLKDGSGLTAISGTIAAASGNLSITASAVTSDIVLTPGATSGWIDFSVADGAGFRNDNRFTDGVGYFRSYGNSDAERYYFVRSNTGDANAGGFGANKGRGSLSGPVAPSSGDDLANFWGGGFNTSAWVNNKGGMVVRTAEAWGTTANGTAIVFRTTPNTTTTPADAVTIGNDKSITGLGSIVTSNSTAGFGYATGAGGTVTQITSRSTGVTLNKICGAITTDTTSLASGVSATFTVTDSACAVGDVPVLAIRSGATQPDTDVYVSGVAAGSFNITVYNHSGGLAETGAIIINFVIIKAVSS